MSTLSPQDKKFYIITAISLLIMFGFGELPVFGQVTPMGMRILGIFLGCIFAWCFGELVWSSVLGLVLLGIYGFGNINSNFSSSFANGTLALMFTATVFCYSVQKSGALTEVAKWIVGMKWVQTGPWGLTLGFFIASAVLGAAATNIVPVMILMWALFYETAKELGIKPNDPLAVIILCGIGVCGYIGVCVVPYGAMTVLVKGAAESLNPDFVFNIGHYMLLNLITVVVFLPLVVLVLKLVAGKKVHLDMVAREPYKMQLTTEMKIGLAALLFIILSLVVPNFLPAGNPIKVFFASKLSTVGTFMLVSVVLMIIRIKGQPVLDIAEALKEIPWPLFLLVASALGISGYITADGMGVVETVVGWLTPMLEGKSALFVTLFFVAAGLIMTNFLNDVVTCVVLYPIAASFIIAAGGSEMLLAILFAQVTIQGCLMPSGSIVGAMFHGNIEWMRSKDIVFYVSIMEIVLMVVLLGVALIGQMIGV